MKTINIHKIPTYQEYSVKTALIALSNWFESQGYTIEIKQSTKDTDATLKVVGLDWHMYAFRGDTDPMNGLLEPWDEETMIFVKQ